MDRNQPLLRLAQRRLGRRAGDQPAGTGSSRSRPKAAASSSAQIEIFFSILQRRLLKHGTFTSEQDLAEQMLCLVETYNQTATPFQWTYTGKSPQRIALRHNRTGH